MSVVLEKPRKDPFKIFVKILYAVSLVIYIYFLLDGMNFYQTAFQERPHHELYRNLRPAGFRGHGFGIVGTSMMLLMMLYSVRKRTRFFGEFGPVSRWLDIHIYLGIMGPLFVILHTSFKVSGIIAVSFWSMIAVATSGILGRYLYLQIPRNQRGKALNLKEIEALSDEFSHMLKTELQLDDAQFEKLQYLSNIRVSPNENIWLSIFRMMTADVLKVFQNRRLKKRFKKELGLKGKLLKHAVTLINRKTQLQRRMLMLNKVYRLFHYWHIFHKPFAVLMFIILFIHVGVAVWLGYTWAF